MAEKLEQQVGLTLTQGFGFIAIVVVIAFLAYPQKGQVPEVATVNAKPLKEWQKDSDRLSQGSKTTDNQTNDGKVDQSQLEDAETGMHTL